MSIKIEVSNVKAVRKYVNDVSVASTKAMTKALARAAIHVQGEVKTSIAGQRAEKQSVDTGRFLNSVGIRKHGKDNAEVYSDLSYAKFLEFGTSSFPERKHFRNTSNRERGKVAKIFDLEVTQAIKSKGKLKAI